ncbi:MAG: hypothetical protein U0792_07925 [Gemmataceae bacterium]
MSEVLCAKEAAARDLAEIESVVNSPDPSASLKTSKPAKFSKPTAKPVSRVVPTASADSTAGARCEDEDDDFGTPSNAGRRVREGNAAAVSAPVHVPVVPAKPEEIVYGPHGFPDLAADPELIRVRENVARLEEQLREATAKAEESCAVLGLKMGQHNPGRVERIAEELLAAGKSLDDVDAYESRWKLVRRLTGALELAKKAIHPAHENAVRRYLDAAQEQLTPTFEAMHRARAALARAVAAHQHKARLMQAAGFPSGQPITYVNATVPTDPLNIATEFKGLVERGILKPEDIAGLPGIE